MPTIELTFRDGEEPATLKTKVAPLYLQALMFFPHNSERRTRLGNAVLAASLQAVMTKQPNLEVPGHLARFAFEAAPWGNIMDSAKPAVWSPAKTQKRGHLFGGVVAGYILLIPFFVNWVHGRKIGRLKSYEAIQSLFKADKMIGLSKRSLQATWKQYECIAHLWLRLSWLVILQMKRP